MLIILFVSFVILLLIGAPIAYSMGFSSLLALISRPWAMGKMG